MDSSDDRFGQHSRRNVLSAAGGLAGLSMLGVTGQTAQAQTTGERPPVAITASPATTGAGNATYTITVQNVAAQNGQSNVDQVALDFGGVGMNFNAVSRTDVTAIKNPGTAAERQLVVTQTRTSLSGDWPRSVSAARPVSRPSRRGIRFRYGSQASRIPGSLVDTTSEYSSTNSRPANGPDCWTREPARSR
jgi:hypothetical protein